MLFNEQIRVQLKVQDMAEKESEEKKEERRNGSKITMGGAKCGSMSSQEERQHPFV